jgi:hypothetical protein
MAKKAVNVQDLSKTGAKGANIASAISSGGAFASTAISVIGNISDQNQRRRFEQNFAALSSDQQAALERQLLAANSEAERLRILGERLTQLNIQRIGNIANVFAEQERKKRTQQIIIGAGILVFLAAATFIIVKKV